MKKIIFSFFGTLFLFIVLSGSSYASKRYSFSLSGINHQYIRSYSYDKVLEYSDLRYCIVELNFENSYGYNFYLMTNYNLGNITFNQVAYNTSDNTSNDTTSNGYPFAYQGVYIYLSSPNYYNNKASCFYLDGEQPNCHDILFFTDSEDAIDYVLTGNVSSSIYDETLKLDYFKCNTYGVLYYLLLDNKHANFEVGWSDSRIRTVKVDILSTRQDNSFVYNSSPAGTSYLISDYAQFDGDVIKLRATPYKSDGSFGPSLYYSFTASGNSFLTNNYRKLFKTNHIDNTIDIPYTGISGNDTYDIPVEGVGENICYEVNYNPITNEYGDLNVYEIYYSPIVVYPEDTPQELIDDTQEQIINNYTTNNYYETVNNFGTNVNFNYDDISTNDIDNTYHDITGIFSGLASLLGKLTNLLVGLLPGLSSSIASVIVVGFGIIIGVAIIAVIIKIVQVIADILPF